MSETEMELYGKMSKIDAKQLTPEQKKLRIRYLQRQYNKNHKEQIKEYKKKYRETHKEEIKEYYKNNKEEIKEYYKNNKEQKKEYTKKYYENNKEYIREQKKEYYKSPNGKKSNTLSNWKTIGLQETKEELDIIYDMWLTQELCNACDILLTRTGNNCSTDACMDHCHTTNRFRHIICISCNIQDNWKKHFC